MTRGRRVAALVLLAAALGLAALGQYYFFRRREYLWDGVVFLALAALCFVLAWRVRAARPARQPQAARPGLPGWIAWLQARPVPAILIALGIMLSFTAALLSLGRRFDQPTYDVVFLWASGVAAVGLAAVWPAVWPSVRRLGRLHRLRAVPRGTWLEVASVAALTALALVLRIAALDSVPLTLGGDEAWHGLLARQVLRGELQNPFSMGYMSMPTGFYWPLSWSMWLAGGGVTGLRLAAALVGTVTVPVLYLFARDLWGRSTALIAALFLATYDYHIHYSRLGANNVWDPLFVLLALWALDRGLRALGGDSKGAAIAGPESPAPAKPSPKGTSAADRAFLLAGLVMGLSIYFYTGARLLPPLMVVYVGYVWFQRRRRLAGLGLHLVLLLLAFLVAAAPMLSYALTHPNEWNARINQVGIVQSGWLAREPSLTGKSTAQILAEQFLRAAGAFHVFPDRTAWYGAERPLLGPLAGIFALFGMAWAFFRWRDRRYFLVLIWFWSVIVTGGMLTESPPSSQRLVIAIPAVALLVAFGLEQTLGLVLLLAERPADPDAARVGARFPSRTWQNVALGLLVAILALASVRYYFVEFTPARRYGSENGETATMIGHYLRDLGGGYHVYLFGAPHIYWRFGTMAFLAPRVTGQDVVEPLEAPPDFEGDGRPLVFIFLPDRAGELAWVQEAFPGGQSREFYDAAGRLRFVAYAVP